MNNHPDIPVLILFSLLLLPALPSAAVVGQTDSLLRTAKSDVERLTSKEMMGRGYTQGGHIQAAKYISERFREIGLKPVGGTYLHPFPLTVDTFRSRPELAVDGKPLRFGDDFIINPGNRGGKEKRVRIVRVGSGLRLGERLNDFTGKDLKGSLAVIETTIPDSIKSDTTIPKGSLDLNERITAALEAGAEGTALLVDRPTYGNFFEAFPEPVFHLRRDAFPSTASTASFNVRRTEKVKIESHNVVGLLEGTGESDSIVILCGHYDHLGAIDEELYFPGANDNASGIALMLALAEGFAEKPLRYDILFVAFSGEEAGLWGSRFFARFPPVPLDRVRFLVNIDMAASGLDGIMVLGGVDFPEEFALVEGVHTDLGISGSELRKRENGPNSDHWFLLQKGIRGFYIYPFTGEQPYHHVDDRPETLQWETFGRMFRLIDEFLHRLE